MFYNLYVSITLGQSTPVDSPVSWDLTLVLVSQVPQNWLTAISRWVAIAVHCMVARGFAVYHI